MYKINFNMTDYNIFILFYYKKILKYINQKAIYHQKFINLNNISKFKFFKLNKK